jgi:hypothetical protein
MDHAPGISAKVVSLRRSARYGGEQATAGNDRAKGMQPGGAVAADRRQVRDREGGSAGRNRTPAVKCDDARPEAAGNRSNEGGAILELSPGRHEVDHGAQRLATPMNSDRA